MNLKQLRYFLAVAEEKQITAAAKRLFIAQPPLSYQLKQLEKELEVKLFVRTAYGIELTDAGRELQSYAEKIVALAETAEEQVHKTAKGELGTIKIGSASSSVGELPSAAFVKLTKYYPTVSFDVFEENSFGVLEKLRNGTIDLGIVRTPFNHHGIESKTLTNEKMTLVTTDEKLLNKKAVTLKDLVKQSLIIYRRFENIFNESFAHQGLTPFYAVKCDDSRTAILWAQKGMGSALVPESIANLYASGQFVPVKHASWQTHLQLVWRSGKVSPLTQRIIDLFN
ncbi:MULTISPECIES: LysR family transcriptional regulator [Lactobacillus]|uniref:LysR family transcriptional regulator n=1 Tax=Lactobacillus xujianguonis TaxID=2495899 RepID=A0A437ST28_9LACO|nr:MULTISPECIES: LysR family transcriptional regulator [Lactobacillus]RVU70106.1 LysR family transcriptional regulator [Lactobacillus xujianguonis]RVU72272.1 LysR family transcriptional regulator [Lactobacillus xujianguonis]